MMMSMGGSGSGSMGSMGGSGGGSMGMMTDPSMMNMGSMGGSSPMAMGQMPMMNPYGYPPQGMPMNMGYANSGFDFMSLIGLLFNFALNLLSLALVLALIVGTIIFIKRYLFEGNMNLSGIFSTKTYGTCSCCGQPLRSQTALQQQNESKQGETKKA